MSPADAFETYLAWSDRALTVRPGQSALQALIDAGVAVEPRCQTGGCGMCVTAHVEGDIIQRDNYLSASDRERYFCPCASRAKTRIILAQ